MKITKYKVMLNMDGAGKREHEVYRMPLRKSENVWNAVTDVPCPVARCKGTVCWHEDGHVPGYRVCRSRSGKEKHRFIAAGATLIRL